MNRYAIYALSADQDQTQIVSLRKYAARVGGVVVAEFSDTSKIDRTGLNALKESAARREFDFVLVVNADRISRNVADVIAFAHHMNQLDIAVVHAAFEPLPQIDTINDQIQQLLPG